MLLSPVGTGKTIIRLLNIYGLLWLRILELLYLYFTLTPLIFRNCLISIAFAPLWFCLPLCITIILYCDPILRKRRVNILIKWIYFCYFVSFFSVLLFLKTLSFWKTKFSNYFVFVHFLNIICHGIFACFSLILLKNVVCQVFFYLIDWFVIQDMRCYVFSVTIVPAFSLVWEVNLESWFWWHWSSERIEKTNRCEA